MIIIMAETIFGIIFNRLFKIVRLRALTNHLMPGKGMVSVNFLTGGSECKSSVHMAKKIRLLLNVRNSISVLNTRPEFDFYLYNYKFV